MSQLVMYPGQVNSPATESAGPIDDTQTTISVINASILPDAPNIATIGVGENAETILYTSKDNVTNELKEVTRGFQSGARAWNAGIKIRRLFTAYDWDSIRQNHESHLAEMATRDTLGHIKLPSAFVAITALQNGWVSFSAPQVRKDGFDNLALVGSIVDGTTTAGTILFTLPEGYRPTARQIIVGNTNAGTSGSFTPIVLDCRTDGTVRLHDTSAVAKKYIQLSGLFLI